jgi:predicted alpha/beta hydrolase
MVLGDGSERRGRDRARRPRQPDPEPIDIRTDDERSLRADLHEPRATAVGIAVFAHAMMARRSEFDRPRGRGLGRWFAERGWRVVTFDFRGHGDSGPLAHEGARYGYDDFVTHDLPAVYAFARSRVRRQQPLVIVGHALGGQVALAAQGAGRVAFDGIVTIGANVWLRELEPSGARWLFKRAALRTVLALSRRLGRFPARTLGLGSDDESLAYVEDVERFARTGSWASRDGADYGASLGRVRVPVLQVVSEGDRLECVPECGERFVSRCGGPHEVLRVFRGDDDEPAPNHTAMVTGAAARGTWQRIESWTRRVLGSGARP